LGRLIAVDVLDALDHLHAVTRDAAHWRAWSSSPADPGAMRSELDAGTAQAVDVLLRHVGATATEPEPRSLDAPHGR
jgi:hypothetical protein